MKVLKVIEKNVITGKVITRPYTQKELDTVAIATTLSANKKKIRDKEEDIRAKREAAIEELLISGTSIEAKAYQDVKAG